MPKLIPNIICLIVAFVYFCGLSGAAPITWRSDLHGLSCVDTVYGQAQSTLTSPGSAHVSRPLFHALSEYNEQLQHPWVDDGSDIVVLERRGFLDFFRNIGNKIKEGFQKVGEGIKHVAQKVGEGIKTAANKVKEGFQTAGAKIKEGFQTAGAKMKEGFQKAGTWIKENGAKVAKFGLKIAATVGAVAAHVVRFIPIVGQAASTALKGASFGLNKASEAIHANLGDKLEKGMKIMDVIQDPIGALVHKAANAVAPKLHGMYAAHQAAHQAHTAPPPPYHPGHPPPSYHAATHVASPHPNGAPPPYHPTAHVAAAHHDVHAAPPAHHDVSHHAAAPPPAHHAAAAPPPSHHAAPPPPHHH